MAAEERLKLSTEAAEKARDNAETRAKQRDEAIDRAGFADEAAVKAAVLEEVVMTELAERVHQFERRCHTVQEQIAALDERCLRLDAQVVREERELRVAIGDHLTDDDAPVEVWVDSQAKSLTKSRKAHKQAKDDLDAAERALEKAESKENAAQARIKESETSKGRLEVDRQRIEQRLSTMRDEIEAVTEGDDPAGEAATLAVAVEGLDRARRTAATEAATSENQLMGARERLRLTAEAAEKARDDAFARTRRRDEELLRAGFADEVAVRAAVLDDETRAAIADRVLAYRQELHTVKQRMATLNQELGDVRVSDEELAAAEEHAKRLNEEVEKQHGEQKTLEEKVGRERERLERVKTLRAQLATERQDLRVYDQLASDLRSDRFQAYVLEEAFTELVQGASERLLALTGERYSLLFRDESILVVDNDNAGETRISDTLSGGETFLTSLSLALELSNQVQRASGAVNLDSLFIDEGFGTLDPNTLALVSETIQNLRVGGRMVGIITHIPELRDEFAQQIIVTKHQGYSTVQVRGLGDDVAAGSSFLTTM